MEKEYLGAGPVAKTCAKLDSIDRKVRRLRMFMDCAEAETITLEGRDAALFVEHLGQIAKPALTAAGLCRHGRHAKWRRRRMVTTTETNKPPVPALALDKLQTMDLGDLAGIRRQCRPP